MKSFCRSTASVLLLLLAGCGRPATKTATTVAGSDRHDRVVARIGDEVITAGEIDKRIALELFELRSGAMRAVLVDHLLQRESHRRGVDLMGLRQLEVESKVPWPSETETTAAVADWVKDGRLKPEEAAAMTPAMAADRLRALRLNAAEEAYYDRLMKENEVAVDFSALGKPELALAFDGPTLGPADAPIKIVEFADLSQPYTSTWQPTLEKLVEKYGTRVQFRFKQKATGPNSDGAKLAEAALCAGDQGRYWEFRKALMKGPGSRGLTALSPAAARAELNVAAFETCLASGSKRATVAENAREAGRNRLEGDPVLLVNGIILSGAQDLATVERLLRLESGVL